VKGVSASSCRKDLRKSELAAEYQHTISLSREKRGWGVGFGGNLSESCTKGTLEICLEDPRKTMGKNDLYQSTFERTQER